MLHRSCFLTWFHLHLLLGERILALRASLGQVDAEAEGEVQSNGTTTPHQVDQPVWEGEVQSNGTPAPGQTDLQASEGEAQSNGTPPPGQVGQPASKGEVTTPSGQDQPASKGEVRSNGTTPPDQMDQPASEGEVQSNGMTPPDQMDQPASEGEVQSNGTTPPGQVDQPASEGGGQSHGPPPERAECGFNGLEKASCAWLFCKHEKNRAALERKKRESEEGAGVSSLTRVSLREDQRRRSAEKRFLTRKGTERLLYKAMIYLHKGRHCEWALNSAKFEGWLEKLFPSRSRCVKEVIRQFEPDEEKCAEGLTDNFKKELRENCKDVDEINPYQAAEKARRQRGFVGAEIGGALFAIGAQILLGAPVLFGAVGLPLLFAGLVLLSIVGLGAFTVLLCKRLGRNWVRFRNRPKRRVGMTSLKTK